MESPLIHLIYSSASTRGLSRDELDELLRLARANNQRLGLTGMLLYIGGSFFQVLEGEAAVVDGLFAKIALDNRHQRKAVIIREPISRRAFAEWTMGYSTVTEQEVSEVAGLNDFFGKSTVFEQLDGGRAKKLLAAFAEGRWRSRLAGPAPQVAAA